MQLDADQLADIVAAGIQAAVGPLLARLAVLEARPQVAGPPGLPGRDGLNGKDGSDGRDGRDGKDGLNGKDGADGVDGKDGATGRDGKDGADGLHGKDGAPGRDGKDGIDGLHGKDGAPGRDGKDGIDGLHGKDGAPGRDGTLEGLREEWTDERTRRWVRGSGAVIPGSERRIGMAIYRGIWDATRTYDEGDQVTCQGSTWLAKTTTTQRPDDDGPGARDWTLCAKRGAVGPRGPEGKPGVAGKDGAPGRDLTAMDSTGRKW